MEALSIFCLLCNIWVLLANLTDLWSPDSHDGMNVRGGWSTKCIEDEEIVELRMMLKLMKGREIRSLFSRLLI